jgi:uncharacterized membrane protein YfcA
MQVASVYLFSNVPGYFKKNFLKRPRQNDATTNFHCAFSHSLQFAVPVVMVLDFIASLVLGNVGGKKADWGEIRLLLPFSLIGASFGIFALIRFPSDPTLFALGLFVLYFGLRNVLGVQSEGHISRLWAVPAGLIGSSAGALFGTSAPPYIIYLTHRLPDKTAVRATFSWLFVIDGGFRLLLMVMTGLLLNANTQIAIGLSLVPMALGLYFGNKVHLDISRETMLKIVGSILVGSGGTLIAKVVI